MKRFVSRISLLIIATVVGQLVPIHAAAVQNSASVTAATPQAAATPAKPSPDQAAAAAAEHAKQMRNDWPWLGKYHDADSNLPPAAPGENRVVFMGDSITELWRFDGQEVFSPASLTSIAESAGSPHPICCSGSART